MKDHIDITQARALKAQTEHALNLIIAKQLAVFVERTELQPDGFSVQLDFVHSMCHPPRLVGVRSEIQVRL